MRGAPADKSHGAAGRRPQQPAAAHGSWRIASVSFVTGALLAVAAVAFLDTSLRGGLGFATLARGRTDMRSTARVRRGGRNSSGSAFNAPGTSVATTALTDAEEDAAAAAAADDDAAATTSESRLRRPLFALQRGSCFAVVEGLPASAAAGTKRRAVLGALRDACLCYAGGGGGGDAGAVAFTVPLTWWAAARMSSFVEWASAVRSQHAPGYAWRWDAALERPFGSFPVLYAERAQLPWEAGVLATPSWHLSGRFVARVDALHGCQVVLASMLARDGGGRSAEAAAGSLGAATALDALRNESAALWDEALPIVAVALARLAAEEAPSPLWAEIAARAEAQQRVWDAAGGGGGGGGGDGGVAGGQRGRLLLQVTPLIVRLRAARAASAQLARWRRLLPWWQDRGGDGDAAGGASADTVGGSFSPRAVAHALLSVGEDVATGAPTGSRMHVHSPLSRTFVQQFVPARLLEEMGVGHLTTVPAGVRDIRPWAFVRRLTHGAPLYTLTVASAFFRKDVIRPLFVRIGSGSGATTGAAAATAALASAAVPDAPLWAVSVKDCRAQVAPGAPERPPPRYSVDLFRSARYVPEYTPVWHRWSRNVYHLLAETLGRAVSAQALAKHTGIAVAGDSRVAVAMTLLGGAGVRNDWPVPRGRRGSRDPPASPATHLQPETMFVRALHHVDVPMCQFGHVVSTLATREVLLRAIGAPLPSLDYLRNDDAAAAAATDDDAAAESQFIRGGRSYTRPVGGSGGVLLTTEDADEQAAADAADGEVETARVGLGVPLPADDTGAAPPPLAGGFAAGGGAPPPPPPPRVDGALPAGAPPPSLRAPKADAGSGSAPSTVAAQDAGEVEDGEDGEGDEGEVEEGADSGGDEEGGAVNDGGGSGGAAPASIAGPAQGHLAGLLNWAGAGGGRRAAATAAAAGVATAPPRRPRRPRRLPKCSRGKCKVPRGKRTGWAPPPPPPPQPERDPATGRALVRPSSQLVLRFGCPALLLRRPRIMLVRRRSTRSWRNFDALRDALLGTGASLRIFDDRGLPPLLDALRLFHAADIIVGAHGAGLTNVMAASPGAAVMEVAPEGWAGLHYARLALLAGLEYHRWEVAGEKRAQVTAPVEAMARAVCGVLTRKLAYNELAAPGGPGPAVHAPAGAPSEAGAAGGEQPSAPLPQQPPAPAPAADVLGGAEIVPAAGAAAAAAAAAAPQAVSAL